jgi:hypothetical protein
MIDSNHYNPKIVDNKVIQINIYQMDVKRSRCILEAKDIESGWNDLKEESNDLTSVPSLPRYQLGHRLLVLITTSVYENELRVA